MKGKKRVLPTTLLSSGETEKAIREIAFRHGVDVRKVRNLNKSGDLIIVSR